MWDVTLSFSDLGVGQTLRNSLLIFSAVRMLVDIGEQSLEGQNKGGAQEVDEPEVKQGCREGPGAGVLFRDGAVGLKGASKADLWSRGMEVMVSHWEHVTRGMPGT